MVQLGLQIAFHIVYDSPWSIDSAGFHWDLYVALSVAATVVSVMLIAVGVILVIISRSRKKAINGKYSDQRSDSMSYSGSF